MHIFRQITMKPDSDNSPIMGPYILQVEMRLQYPFTHTFTDFCNALYRLWHSLAFPHLFLLNAKFLYMFWLPFSEIKWYKKYENISSINTHLLPPSATTAQILVLERTWTKKGRIRTFEEWKKRDILGRGHSISKGLRAGHIRLCMTNSEHSLSVREGSAVVVVEKGGLRSDNRGSW